MNNTFEKLSDINVNGHVEKKQGLSYLTWAWAWAEAKKACPDANYKILPTEFDENLGYMCHTEVTIDGETLEMWLPVMDGANKAMKSEPYSYETKYGQKQVQSATMFDVNKTIMRCLVKNLAMFGLGLYIYAGEDLPEVEAVAAGIHPTPTTHPDEEPDKMTAKKPTLETGTVEWSKVESYINANKNVALDVLIANVERKFFLPKETVAAIEAVRK